MVYSPMMTYRAILIDTARDFSGLLFSTFWLKVLALGACPVVLLVLAWGALS